MNGHEFHQAESMGCKIVANLQILLSDKVCFGALAQITAKRNPTVVTNISEIIYILLILEK